MALTKRGIELLYGLAKKPLLPAGWVINQCKDDFSIAVNPEGTEFLIGPDFLYPRFFNQATGKHHIDTTKVIPIPRASSDS